MNAFTHTWKTQGNASNHLQWSVSEGDVHLSLLPLRIFVLYTEAKKKKKRRPVRRRPLSNFYSRLLA
ncbi:hypothetical protein TSMEX_007918 [Taenia solium]|eukprot:TsM_000194700 transcript=TsM_000194700 gene=TsM_000194700